MTAMGMISHPGAAWLDGAHPVGQQLAAWLAPYPAKRLARLFGVEPRTAKAWRSGELPQNRHLIAMVALWGRPFIDHIFAPVLVPAPADLARRLERLQIEISDIRRVIDGGAGLATADGLSAPAGERMARAAQPALAGAAVAVRRAGVVACLVAALAGCFPGADPGRPVRTRRITPITEYGRRGDL